MKKLYGFLIAAAAFTASEMQAQAYLDDVMLQSFGWDEHQQTRVSDEGGLYAYYTARADVLSNAGFDMIWFPPPSHSTGGVGYLPTQYFRFDQTSWGTEAQMDAMLAEMETVGIHPIADIVVNHRNGTTSWMDFTDPAWGCEAVVSNDEANGNPSNPGPNPCGNPDTGDGFNGGRDLDHTNATVRNDIKTFLNMLKNKGFDGWRYDVAKGFSAVYFGEYNESSQPYFSVGEYWDGDANTLANWVNGTGNTLSGTTTPSAAFDFSAYYTLSGAVQSGNYSSLNTGGGNSMIGLAGRSGYADKAVTFIDNHDTFVHSDAFLGDNIMKGYAYILTHPGIPTVFGPHYFGGTYSKDGVTRTYSSHRDAINKLIEIRKQTGIDAFSHIDILSSGNFYAARIKQRVTDADYALVVKIGPGTWNPGAGWTLNTFGTDYAVWTNSDINAAPSIEMSPGATSYVTGDQLAVTLTATDPESDAVTIHYTTDGTTPTTSSPTYSAPLNLTSTTTVKAMAVDSQGNASGVITKEYTFSDTNSITIYFQPPNPNPTGWIPPHIHFWGAVPDGSVTGSDWASPPQMTEDPNYPGWYYYTFDNVVSINFLFRIASAASWTPGVNQTGDITNVTEDTWYVWDTSSATFVSTTDPLSTVDVSESATKTWLEIAPNPVVNGRTTLSYANAENGSISVYNVDGKLVDQFTLESNEGKEEITINYPTGIYFMKLDSEQGSDSQKFIVR